MFSVTIHIKENTVDGEELLKCGKLHLVTLYFFSSCGRSVEYLSSLERISKMNIVRIFFAELILHIAAGVIH